MADLFGAMVFLLQGTEGLVTPLWEGAAIWSGAGAEGVAVGLPTTLVVGALVAEPIPL